MFEKEIILKEQLAHAASSSVARPDWMGHTDLASTLRYLKPNRNQVREKVEAIWK